MGRRFDPWAMGLIAAGVALRAAALLAGVPATNSDEATMGLMAWHIAGGERFPVFFYGQSYMGALEAYLAAPLFAVFGPSTGLLRLQTLAWFALLLWAVYRLALRLYSRRVALAATAFLAFGADRVVKDQLIAAGGYPEIVPIAALLVLLALALADRGRPVRTDLAGFAAWGLLAGIALWDDWIVLPYLAVAGALLVAFRGRDLAGRAGAALAGGLALGAAPLLLDNLTGRSNSLAVFWSLNRTGATEAAGATLGDHLYGGVLLGVPLAGGLCPPGRCGAAQTWAGVAYVVLLAVSGWLALAGLRRLRRRAAAGGVRAAAVGQAGRLALVTAGVGTLLSYTVSPAAVVSPVESARYLAIAAVSLPAVLFPVAVAPALVRRRWPAAARPARAARAAVAGFVLLLAATATWAAFGTAPAVRAEETAQRRLIAVLDRIGVTEIYSDYWTCNRLAFATRERIVCATIQADLRAAHDRYPPYRARVAAAQEPTFAFVSGSDVDRAFAAHLARLGVAGNPRPAGKYAVYRPDRPVGLPTA